MNNQQNGVPCWRCRLCGTQTPIEKSQCENPQCGADLRIYGVVESAADTPDQPESQAGRPIQPGYNTGYYSAPYQTVPENSPNMKKSRKVWIPVILIAVFAVGIIAGAAVSMFAPWFTSHSPASPQTSSTLDSETSVANTWSENVLMRDVYNWVRSEQIGTITFLDSLDSLEGPNAPEQSKDVSEAHDGSVIGWTEMNEKTNLFDLFIAADGGVSAPENSSALFEGYSSLQKINFNGAFHTENTTRMDSMFNGCSSLTELDVTNFDTSSVTNMAYMFSGCSGLTELDISNFDTSSVTSMNVIFGGCSGLTELDLSNFDTSSVISMDFMFSGCSGLTELDVTNFDTSSVTSMIGTFNGCSGLTELDLSNFDTSSVIIMGSMFSGVRDDIVLHYNPNTFVIPDGMNWEKLFEEL